MKYRFTIRIGETAFEIEGDASTQEEFIQQVDFWQSLPAAGPNGEADLRFCYRTPKGYKYYSIVCDSAGMEFQLGCLKPTGSGNLFPKGWVKMQREARHYDEVEREALAVGATSAPASAPIETGLEDAKPPKLTLEELGKLARPLVPAVRKTSTGYEVRVTANRAHVVTKPFDKVVCDCARFQTHYIDDWTYRCEHVLAVAYSIEQQTKAA